MTDVFISSVEEDLEVTSDIIDSLESAGFSTWYYQKDSIPGISYLVQIGEAIKECRVFILLISKASIDSHQITIEVERAHEEAKHFLPILVDISHNEFIARQPVWRQILGSRFAINIPPEGVSAIMPRILKSMKSLTKKTEDSERKQRQYILSNGNELITKSRVLAGMLGLIIGGLGIHQFYLGNYGKGVSMLVLNLVGLVLIVSCFGALVGIPLLYGVWIWGVAEGVMILSGRINRNTQWQPIEPSSNQVMTAGLLAIFSGYLGAHRFYLGYTGIGVIMLLLFVIGLVLWQQVNDWRIYTSVLSLSMIWGIIEGILIFKGKFSHDASGYPLQD